MGNIISATNESNDENVKKYVTPILEKLPFDYLINNEPDGRFRWLGERLCFYKPYGRNMATLDWGNWRRNEILSSLVKSKKITTNAQMGDSDFFWGWNVEFTYTKDNIEYNFIYCTNNTVCLVESEGNQKKKKNDDLPDTPENTFYFCVNGFLETRVFCDKLEKIIEEYERLFL